MQKQDNYMDLLEHFKVEELKERLEFDMAAEAAGWDGKAKTKAKGGGTYNTSTGTGKSKGEFSVSTAAPWAW